MASPLHPSRFPSNPFHSHSTLPIITSIIGFGACSVGIYSFLQPIASASVYAIPIPPTTAEQDSSSSPSKADAAEIDVHSTYIYAYGLRYFGTGASVIVLSCFYAQKSYSAWIRQCLGIVLLCGSLTSAGDAVVAREMKRSDDGVSRAVFAHSMRSLVWAVAGVVCVS